MLLLDGIKHFLVCIEKMLIIIDKNLSSACNLHSILDIMKTDYGAKIEIQEIVEDINIHFTAIFTLHRN